MSNMFSALADSDSEEEMKMVEKKKVTTAVKSKKKPAPAADEGKAEGAREDGEEVAGRGKKRGRGGRGARGDRGRGDRGRGDRGDRGGYRGRGEGRGRGRGEGRGRGRGEGRGRGRGEGRGGYGKDRGRAVYSQHASRDQEGNHEEEAYGGGYGGGYNSGYGKPHRDFERRSGTGHGKEVKKGGAGKAGWGAAEEDKKYEHMEADAATKEANKTEEEEKTPVVEAPKEEEKPEEVEEDINNYTYADYLADQQEKRNNIKKTTARAPEALKVKNTVKYEKIDTSKKMAEVKTSKYEAYAPGALTSNTELGFEFGAIEVEEEEDSYRPRGGRGGYRGDRGGHHGGDRGGYEGGRGRGGPRKKFIPVDDDFPAL